MLIKKRICTYINIIMTYLITGIFSAISLSFDYRMLAASEKSKDILLVSLVSLEFGMFLAI